MTDELVRELQRDWQSLDCDADEIVRRLRRNRWMPHLVLALEILGCVLALCVGLWFAWVAVNNSEHRLLFTLSAGILLIAVPVLGVATAMARRASLAWDAETPESILRIGVRRAEASLRVMRVGRWHIAIIASFVAVLWMLQLMGFIDAWAFLVFYTAVCAIVSLVSWFWMARRIRAVSAERDACARLLTTLQVE